MISSDAANSAAALRLDAFPTVIFMLAGREGSGEGVIACGRAFFAVAQVFAVTHCGGADTAFPGAASKSSNGFRSSADSPAEEAAGGFLALAGAANGSWPSPTGARLWTAGLSPRTNGSRPHSPSRIAAKKKALNTTEFRMIVLLIEGKRGK
jgi:hypothetical protein